jgi:hypothetical protein
LMKRWFPPLLLACLAASLEGAPQTQHVLFVMTDGLRWQEVFAGSDPALVEKGKAAIGREALMPFLWNVVAVLPIRGSRATIKFRTPM